MDTRFRLALAASIALLPLLPLAYRLTYLQVFEHRSLDNRASGEFSRSAEEIVPRADVLDRNGKVLAQSIPVWTCFVDKRMMPTLTADAVRRLAPILKLSPSALTRRFRQGGRFAALQRDLTFEQSQAVAQAKIEGIGVSPSEQRFYPNGELARSVLGQVSMDGRGIAGIELSLDKRLTGKARKLKVIRDGSGRMIYRDIEKDASAPEPVQLTIDRSIQYFAEEALGEAGKQLHMQQGIAVVQDPSNGDILAMAVYPPNPLKNPIVQDTYEPGSTFKTFTAAAALDSGDVKTTDTFFCENGAYQIAPGTIIHDHEPVGTTDLAGILQYSSNIGAAKVSERLGPETFYRYARAFGFASKTGLPLPGETAGEIRPMSALTRVVLAASAYGYGVAVSPLQIVSAYSAVANGGILYQPRLLSDDPVVKIRRVASPDTIQKLVPMLENVVEKAATVARIPGYRVAGKTGTARRLDPLTKKYSQTSYNGSFAGFLPASRPRWTILVVISAPKGEYYGAQVAAPVFARIAKQLLALYAVAPDKPAAPLVTVTARAARPALAASARPIR